MDYVGDGLRRLHRVLRNVEEECRRRTIYMLGPEKAAFVAQMVEKTQPGTVVECGTAIGYSGLHIAAALMQKEAGRLITIEIDRIRAEEALSSFRRAGVDRLVEMRTGDAVQLLSRIDEPVDFLLLDNDFCNYYPCFRSIRGVLSDGAVIVADNAGIGGESMADYLAYVRARYECRTHWFDTDLPWASRDAMEVTIYRK
jgi:predicted O-methyltransferase YrrM